MVQIKNWEKHSSWEEAEKEWESRKEEASKKHPLKLLKKFPSMPGMTADTAKNIRWKSLKWMVEKDIGWRIFRYILKSPWLYLKRYVASILSKESFKREGDFFFYGINSLNDFQKLLQTPNTLFILGFSYCHKPFECPSGRFTDQCVHDTENLVCQQCFIGKCVHAAPAKATLPIYIPTVHYIGQKVFEAKEKHPDKKIIFLITACEMTLTMFADWGNMAGIEGIGIRLDGRICNTMRAFALSEEGIKPGLTVVLDETQKKMLDLIRVRRDFELLHNP